MRIQLSTADAVPLVLEISAEQLVADASLSRPPDCDVTARLPAALAEPVGYPPLSQAVLPGDRLTLAVDPELPQAAEVVGTLIGELLQAGREPGDITVLVSRAEQRESLLSAWPAAWRDAVTLVLHDADDETMHAYLAATREGFPVYLNRAIGDADVFLPIGMQRLDDALDERGVHGGWFPAFSNREAQLRHQSPGNVTWQAHRRRRRQETDEAAWLLGVRLVIQVLPGPVGGVAGVWCGDAEEVVRVAGQACRNLWLREVDRPAELVIATLDAAAEEQSWQQLARALAMASRAVVDGGTIVVWTDLATDPGPALKSLAHCEESDDEQRLSLMKLRSADAMAAKVILDCLQRTRIYLRSRLDDAVVEEIGLATLHDVAELQRLVHSAESCLVLSSAQHAGVHVKQPVEA